MKTLVTGAAGFIGSHLAEALAAAGHTVVGVDCFTDYYPRPLKERNTEAFAAAGISVVELDLADGDLDPLLEGVDAVYHLAAQPGLSATTSEAAYRRNNVEATRRLVDACVRSESTPFFVQISTSSVYGKVAVGDEETEPQPISEYGRTKLEAEGLVMKAAADGLAACSLRIFSVYGPRERPEKLVPLLIHCIAQGKPFPLFAGSLEHVRSFTYVGDIVAGCLAALDRRAQVEGEIINLGSAQTHSTAGCIAAVAELMGRGTSLQTLPARSGDQLHTEARIDKAKRLLGYEPTTSLKEGLAAEVAWFVGDPA